MLRRRRDPSPAPVDPWSVPAPWRDLLRAVVDAQERFERAASGVPAGPTRARVEPYVARVDDVVRHAAATASLAATVDTPGRAGQATTVSVELARLQADGPLAGDASRRREEVLAAQLRSLRRAQAVGAEAADQLRLLAARIDDATLALIELQAPTGTPTAEVVPLLSVFDEIDALHAGIRASAGFLEPPDG